MNLVILSGKISNIKYGLVDRGKIYSIAFLDVKVLKSEMPIQIICKNNEADYVYRNMNIGTNVILEGKIHETKEKFLVFVKKIKEIQWLGVKNG